MLLFPRSSSVTREDFNLPRLLPTLLSFGESTQTPPAGIPLIRDLVGTFPTHFYACCKALRPETCVAKLDWVEKIWKYLQVQEMGLRARLLRPCIVVPCCTYWRRQCHKPQDGTNTVGTATRHPNGGIIILAHMPFILCNQSRIRFSSSYTCVAVAITATIAITTIYHFKHTLYFDRHTLQLANTTLRDLR